MMETQAEYWINYIYKRVYILQHLEHYDRENTIVVLPESIYDLLYLYSRNYCINRDKHSVKTIFGIEVTTGNVEKPVVGVK